MLMVHDVEQNRFVLVNRAAEKALGVSRAELIGKRVYDVFSPEDAELFAAQDLAVLTSGDELFVRDRRCTGATARSPSCAPTSPGPSPARSAPPATSPGGLRGHHRAPSATRRASSAWPTTTLADRPGQPRDVPSRDSTKRLKLTRPARRRVRRGLHRPRPLQDGQRHPGPRGRRQPLLQACRRAAQVLRPLGRRGGAARRRRVRHPADRRRRPPTRRAALAQRIVEARATCRSRWPGTRSAIGASIGIALAPVGRHRRRRAAEAAPTWRSTAPRPRAAAASQFFRGRPWTRRIQARRALELDLRKALTPAASSRLLLPAADQPRPRTGSPAARRCCAGNHPERGLVSPAEFIPLAEEIGLISPLGEWVLQTACREAAPAGRTTRKLAVNISPVQFRSRTWCRPWPTALAGFRSARRSGWSWRSPRAVLLGDDAVEPEDPAPAARAGRAHLARRFRHRLFVAELPAQLPVRQDQDRPVLRARPAGRPDSLAIIKAVTGLSASLGMLTTAEGVETAEQFAELRAQGCSEIQGFLIGRPYPVEELRRAGGRGQAEKPRGLDRRHPDAAVKREGRRVVVMHLQVDGQARRVPQRPGRRSAAGRGRSPCAVGRRAPRDP